MKDIIIDFVSRLRKADFRVSPAETLDAVSAAALIGYDSEIHFRMALATVLAKTVDEKQRFDRCFDQFFYFPESTALSEPAAESNTLNSLPENNQSPDGQQPDSQSDTISSEELELQLTEAFSRALSDREAVLMRSLVTGDQAERDLMLQQAAEEVGTQDIRFATQRSLFVYRILQALGATEIRSLLMDINEAAIDRSIKKDNGQTLHSTQPPITDNDTFSSPSPSADSASEWLAGALLQLRRDAEHWVDKQLLQNNEAQLLRDTLLSERRLSEIERRYFHDMHVLVRKMSKALIAKHRRRRSVQKKGQLDVPKTLRVNMRHQGVLFDTRWKHIKKERPDLFVICDVSGSVSAYSKFFLMFLYSLSELIPNTRAFAFSAELGEVTQNFSDDSVEQAVEKVNQQWGFGSTDYGVALEQFSALAAADLRHNSTVIVLGDARCNGGDPRLKIMREVYDRCQRVLWLNPESKSLWGTGDSEMQRYLSCVHQADSVQTLNDLEKVISRLLRALQ